MGGGRRQTLGLGDVGEGKRIPPYHRWLNSYTLSPSATYCEFAPIIASIAAPLLLCCMPGLYLLVTTQKKNQIISHPIQPKKTE